MLASKRIGPASDSDDSEAEEEAEGKAARVGPPTDEELFRACGGRRLGMRARASQTGKWKRAEEGLASPPAQPVEAAAEEADKKEKKTKKEKKEKKEKKAKRKKESADSDA